MKSRRTVEHNDRPRTKSSGRGPKLWAYGYSDLARLLRTTEGALRARVNRGTLKPGDLSSLVEAAVFKEYCRLRDYLHDELGIPGCGDFYDCVRDIKAGRFRGR